MGDLAIEPATVPAAQYALLSALSVLLFIFTLIRREEPKEKTKGSRLPFFQKLRRNTSADKEKEKDSTKGR